MNQGLPVHVVHVAWSEQQPVLSEIRRRVFIEEQEIPKDLEWDGLDETSEHFLAINSAGQHLGCARLLPTGQIGRMAVLAEHRGTGIGMELLQAAVEHAKTRGDDRVFLHAQAYAESFYRRGGFLPTGEVFEEAGIPHIGMEMKLPVAFAAADIPRDAAATRPADANPQAATEDEAPASQPLAVTSHSDAAERLETVVRAARRELLIFSPYLDHSLFDTEALVEAVSAMARLASRSHVQILVLDSKLIVDRGHRLLDLARRLDQKIEIRKLSEPVDSKTSSFVCADHDGYWLLPGYDEYQGVADLYNPVTTKRLRETFQTAWRKAQPDPELRVLRL